MIEENGDINAELKPNWTPGADGFTPILLSRWVLTLWQNHCSLYSRHLLPLHHFLDLGCQLRFRCSRREISSVWVTIVPTSVLEPGTWRDLLMSFSRFCQSFRQCTSAALALKTWAVMYKVKNSAINRGLSKSTFLRENHFITRLTSCCSIVCEKPRRIDSKKWYKASRTVSGICEFNKTEIIYTQ